MEVKRFPYTSITMYLVLEEQHREHGLASLTVHDQDFIRWEISEHHLKVAYFQVSESSRRADMWQHPQRHNFEFCRFCQLMLLYFCILSCEVTFDCILKYNLRNVGEIV